MFRSQAGLCSVTSALWHTVVMDWVMKNSIQECAGIKWVDGSKRGDLDFADDVALLHDSRDGMQAMTSQLETVEKKLGYK